MGMMAKELNKQQKLANDNEPDPKMKKLGKEVEFDWEGFVKTEYTMKGKGKK